MPDLVFAFAAPVLRQEAGMRFHYLPLPAEVATALEQAGVRRVLADLNGVRFRRAVMPSAECGPHLVTGRIVLREAGARSGDLVEVVLRPDPDPDAVDIPEELEIALDQDEAAAERFHAFPPGKQRSLALYVTQAKRSETRIRRALELTHKLRTRTLYGDRNED